MLINQEDALNNMKQAGVDIADLRNRLTTAEYRIVQLEEELAKSTANLENQKLDYLQKITDLEWEIYELKEDISDQKYEREVNRLEN